MLAGTDLEHHHDFVEQGEATRRMMQARINDGILRYSEKTAEGRWRARAGRELWQTIPAFAYEPPSWRKALAPYGPALALLALWLFGTFVAALLAVTKLRAV